jgi:hypothetical protein
MVLKTAPLTRRDLEIIKWTIWEPLRRNQYYKNDYAKLKIEGHLLDPNKIPEFCEKWKLSGPIDPDLSFDELYGPLPGETKKEAAKRIQRIFLEIYIPEPDNAAFVNLMRSCLDGKYLNVNINLSKSRNQIETELKKILDEWLSEKRLEFHDIEKKKTPRLNPTTWKRRFKVFDLVYDPQKRWFYPDIAIKLNKLHPKTVQRLFKEAWVSIYKEPLPPKSERRKKIAIETVEHICVTCEDRICEKTKKLCAKAESYVAQDEIASLKSVDDTNLMDYTEFKKWDIDGHNPED